MVNLFRHLRSSRVHNRSAGLKCPMPECENTKPMRSYNLVRHLQHRHKITSEFERESIVNASTLAKRELDCNRRPWRRSLRELNVDSSTATDEQRMAL